MAKTLSELGAALDDIRKNSKDFAAPLERMSMTQDAKLAVTNGEVMTFETNEVSRGQLASLTEIPKSYFDRLASENKSLLASNVNHALAREASQNPSDRRMIRTVGGKVRAVLSNRYRRIDSFDLLQETLPVLLDSKFKIESCEITDRRVYVKAITDKIQGEVQRGDVVQYGVTISNSDVGMGSLRIEPFLFRLLCSNGMIGEDKFSARHLGRKMTDDDSDVTYFTEETLVADSRAVILKARDTLLGTMKQENFDKEIRRMQAATGMKVESPKLDKVVELACNFFKVTNQEVKRNIFDAFMSGNEGAGLTAWGLANSFTAAAKSLTDYDEATRLQRIGSEVIDLNPSQWRSIACA